MAKKSFEAEVTFNLFQRVSRTILTHKRFPLVEIMKGFSGLNYELT